MDGGCSGRRSAAAGLLSPLGPRPPARADAQYITWYSGTCPVNCPDARASSRGRGRPLCGRARSMVPPPLGFAQ